MSKRAATVQLTADTAEDDEHEEKGQFEMATSEQLGQRVIKTAKRGRQPVQPSGIFAGVKLNFSQTNGTSQTASSSSSSSSSPSSDYLQQLRSLNTSVSEWISRHVKENPHVDLTPIFRDYESHLRNIDSKYSSSMPPTLTSSLAPTLTSSLAPALTSSLAPTLTSSLAPALTSSLAPTLTSSLAPPLTSSLAPALTSSLAPALTSSLAPALTSSLAPVTALEKESCEGGSDDSSGAESAAEEPQKTTAPQNDDKDCLFSVRAKLFYNKEGRYVELGVGTLRVEESGEDRRLLLRNDTTLRTVLLNIRVASGVPVTSKANNVFIVCPPNPPLSKEAPPTVTYLIRVKTASLADQLMTAVKP